MDDEKNESHLSSFNVSHGINRTAEMCIVGLVSHNTYSYFSNPIVYNTSYLHKSRELITMLKTVLTIIQVILCIVIIVLGYEKKEYLNIVIGASLLVISLL